MKNTILLLLLTLGIAHGQSFDGLYAHGKTNLNIQHYFKEHTVDVGHAPTNGITAYVHYISGSSYSASVQDFVGGSHKSGVIFDTSPPVPKFKDPKLSPTPVTFEISDLRGFWTYYKTHGSIAAFGPPTGDERTTSGGIEQEFVLLTLAWNSKDGSLSVKAK